MTEYINIIQNKSVNIYKNMLYNSSESHNILFSKEKKKKTLDRKAVNLESEGSPCWPYSLDFKESHSEQPLLHPHTFTLGLF